MGRLSLFFAVCFAILFNPNGRPASIVAAPLWFQESQKTKIENATFADWIDGQPVGWQIQIGANNGGVEPASQVAKWQGPSLQLSGDRSTRAWNMVSQTLKVKPQQTLRFGYVSQAVGIKREGSQFDNCYVGVFFESTMGKKLSPKVWPVLNEKLESNSRTFRIPQDVNTIDLVIFLSKSGTLRVTDLKLDVLDPADSFDVLIDDMARNYSFLDHKKIDWPSLTERFRKRATQTANPAEFAKVVREMLAELKDVHIWIVHNGRTQYTFKSGYSGNFNFPWLAKQLEDQKKVGSFGMVGRTRQGFGYARINTLSGVNKQDLANMTQELASLFDASAFILDLRANNGGAENVAMVIAGMFTNEKLVYGRQAFRSGEKPGAFTETSPRVLWPSQGRRFDGPVVCLIGPGVVSSAEGFAMMMKAIPNCTLVGLPTRGASGNPAPIELPNGVDVWYSRWMSLLPDGTPIEGTGVQPDVEVEHDRTTDVAFQRAIKLLADQVDTEDKP